MSLVDELNAKAAALGVPWGVQLDLTWRCNERCVHCYLDHEDRGELTTAEILDTLDQLAAAGVFFLTLSGGEPLFRRDWKTVLEHARRLLFRVKLKTNAVLVGDAEARFLRDLNIPEVQVSVYSHRPEVHDAITKLPGSLRRTLDGIERMTALGINVSVANVLLRDNWGDYREVRALALAAGAAYRLDPTVTPMLDGSTAVLANRVPQSVLREVFADPDVVGDVDEFCAPPAAGDADALDAVPCGAGHGSCYISPYGDVFPCVQFPLPTGNIRTERFLDIWQHSPAMNEVRSIRGRDLQGCSSCSHLGSCTRCPGLAYMEGNMYGPSAADCEKSFVRTGIPPLAMMTSRRPARPSLVQISPAASSR